MEDSAQPACEGAEDAAVPGLWAQHGFAARAFVAEVARVRWHVQLLDKSAPGTGYLTCDNDLHVDGTSTYYYIRPLDAP